MIRSEHCSLLPALDRCGCLQDGPTQHRPKDQAQGERDAHSHHGIQKGLDNSDKTTIVLKINGEGKRVF
ncbi:hypothetical protein BRADI_1g12783v3 [Brachypodium distachyon]|uniref:Uncharacterized protein n=1 Tax=Brachypodium distachyon TaxID=15368 RepID=A0A2K2DJ79_BRADI|nr:hypothetical protein BRADI_1g12783v3 [Brachypodium distachyon]